MEAAPDPAKQPTWQPDEAAGAAWLKAGDAAAGAAATGWGTPGDAGGWLPGPKGQDVVGERSPGQDVARDRSPEHEQGEPRTP